MATMKIDAEQLAILLCQQVYHGGNPSASTACPRGDRDGEIERARKLIRIYGTPQAARSK